ncbi:RICIN domain-containing protein [Streptomyces sp. NPDC050508]|uniref:RICIN domain-containing protein n=1 Tax=Streptomyces sp. NPDC050508 TaxID=3155405 RepID=UPI00342930A0
MRFCKPRTSTMRNTVGRLGYRARSLITIVAALTGLLAGGVALGATSASAATARDENLVNGHYANCVDDSGSYGLRMYACNDASYNNGYQKWVEVNNSGSYEFQNVNTGLCLDGSSTYGLRGYACNPASYSNGYQKWVIYESTTSGAWVDWKNVATGECMDYSSTYGLRLYTCNNSSFVDAYQAWHN